MEQALYHNYPTIDSLYGEVHEATLVPRPKKRIPTMFTGFAQQDMDWLGQHGDGWMYYPQAPFAQEQVLTAWREAGQTYGKGFRPFSMPMHLDLSHDPDEPPTPIRFGFRIGRNPLIKLLEAYRAIGVNHLFFALFERTTSGRRGYRRARRVCAPHFPPLS